MAMYPIGAIEVDPDVWSGYYAISPAGHLVIVPAHAPLKAGFRLATAGDLRPAPVAADPDPIVEIHVDE